LRGGWPPLFLVEALDWAFARENRLTRPFAEVGFFGR
jgi:hypothetical protein